MPPISRLGDIGLGHCAFPPTPIASGSGNTFVNSLPVGRISDPLVPHGAPCPSPPHPRSILLGSTSVFVNSLGVARIGDAVDCGGLIYMGSGNTFAGG